MYLGLKDFINIAHVCKGLKTAADEAFRRKFGKEQFSLSKSISSSSQNEMVITDRVIEIYDLKTSLPMLRCYGHLLSNLVIYCCIGSDSMIKAMNKVFQYTNKYCYKSLKMITCTGFEPAFDASMKKPFLKVDTVFIDRCELGQKMSTFNKWFPAMRILNMYYSKLFHGNCVEQHFPHLEE